MDERTIIEHEEMFLQRIRNATRPSEKESDQQTIKNLFTSRDDRQLLAKIQSRNELDHQGLLETFKENGSPLKLHCHLASSPAEAAEVVIGIIESAETEFTEHKQVIQHDHPDLARLGLWKRLIGAAIPVHTTFRDDKELREKTLESFIGITVADFGIADSATLVQLTHNGQPRSTSLLPSVHIGLLRKTDIVANLREAYCLLKRQNNSSMTFISGPSKTADIEAHMVHGAHGPKEMHVIILNYHD